MTGTLFRGLILFLLEVICEGEPTHAGPETMLHPHEQDKLVHQTSRWVLKLFNNSLPFSRAESFCRGQFSSLITLEQSEDKEETVELLRQTGFRSPVWVRDHNRSASKTVALSRQYLEFAALKFPKESHEGFARVTVSFPALSSVSVCVRVQWNTDWNDVSTVFSYAAPVLTNEFQLRGRVDMQGHIHLALIIHGKHFPYKASFANDGAWHHICVTWSRISNHWAIYVDGDRKDMGSGTDMDRDIHEVQATLFCPAVHQQMELQGCRTLQGWSDPLPPLGWTDCSDFLPFICRSSRERHHRMEQISKSQSSQPSAFMNQLMKLSNKSQPVLVQQPSGLDSLAQASALLNISVQALEDTQQEGLQPADMVSLIQLLTLTADVSSEPSICAGNSSHGNIQELSQHFISVADSIIREDNADKWQAIKEVVNGPMDVVKSIDRMVTRLSPSLTADTDHVTIQSPNIKLELQQQRLKEGSKIMSFCGPGSEAQSFLDCISVPHQKIQDLQNNGFYKITLVSMWYGSLRPLFNREENITMEPTVNDGSQRYLGTVLGSSVISTTVLGDDHPVSMAVHFQLQHKVQNSIDAVYDPVCAFWDFDLTPEAGGWWNTKGCEVVSKHYGYTVCYCNHTTNFALLLQVYETQRSPENEKALQVLTFIGCGVSLCGLLFTFILFIAVGVPKSDRTTVHKNLIVALGFAKLLLMCSDWAAENQAACFMVTTLLHLFFMASFCWMLVEGLLLWSKVVSVNISEDRRMKLYYVIGWGLPVLIVGLTLVISGGEYKAQDHCWLSVKTDTIWAFVGPVIFVLMVNAVVLCRVVIVTVSSAHRRAKMLSPSFASKMQTFDLTWAVTRPVLILLPVLGLTWLCGVLVHLSVVVSYMFIVLNSFQGLYIFLVYAVYNSEVRNAIKRIKEKRKALSFTNCSQPTSFSPSQRAPITLWSRSPPTSSSPETSETSGPFSSTSTSLVIKNESFKKESFVSFSLRQASGNQAVQLTGFKPSGC
ncbi:hypothetical protein CRENBAI_022673 [Crenichthys baileyi]|uniref:Adhesion G-protein coupled receptor D2 n=1 Tax=Crenichthys baileyi TaxID=28760 RepID=A0AAV9R362_9TELE